MEPGNLSTLFLLIASALCGSVFLVMIYDCVSDADLDADSTPNTPNNIDVCPSSAVTRGSRRVDHSCKGFVRLVELHEVKTLLFDIVRHLRGKIAPSAEETANVEEKRRHDAGTTSDGNGTTNNIYVVRKDQDGASDMDYVGETSDSKDQRKKTTSEDQEKKVRPLNSLADTEDDKYIEQTV